MLKWQLLPILVIAVFSCKQKDDVLPNSGDKENGEMTQLLGKLENPYSVSNMQKAYNNLQNSNARTATDELEITTTHLYIKFKPKNNQELEILKDDTTLILYSYPMDYKISQGSYYHDPSIPDSLPTYQYCSVAVDKNLPHGVTYEVLENLFIPDEEKIIPSANLRQTSEESIITLVDEALRITNNLEPTSANARVTGRSSWQPAGRIRVRDDITNTYRGVEGVIVKARRWFTTHQGMVNSNGDYSCDGTFKRDANYSLDWERYDFALREGWLDGANINGPKKEGNWDNDFNGDKNAFHAKVFMAAHHYYYKDIKGLRRPPQNGTLKTQMHIRCYNESNDDVNGTHREERRFLGLGSQIKIYNPQNPIDEIYGTTIHELAHASHWNMWRQGEDFDNSDKIVKESWARGVEWILTTHIYPNYFIPIWSKKVGSVDPYYYYTLVVKDLIDNQSGYDNVEGYTIREIEDALQGQKTWDEWKNNIKNKYNNGTENNLDALFDYWN